MLGWIGAFEILAGSHETCGFANISQKQFIRHQINPSLVTAHLFTKMHENFTFHEIVDKGKKIPNKYTFSQ